MQTGFFSTRPTTSSCSDDDEWGLEEEETDFSLSDIKSQVQGGLQAQLFRSSDFVEDTDSVFFTTCILPQKKNTSPFSCSSSTTTPTISSMNTSCFSSAPPPPPPPSPFTTTSSYSVPLSSDPSSSSSSLNTNNNNVPPPPPTPPPRIAPSYSAHSYNYGYHGAPPGIYLYAEPAPYCNPSPFGYQPYLPEEVYASPSTSPVFPTPMSHHLHPHHVYSPPTPRMSEIPNPFSSAHGVAFKPSPPPPPPVSSALSSQLSGTNLRKIAAAGRPRDKEGKFISKKNQQKSNEDNNLLFQTSPPPVTSPSLPLSPQFLEAHVATLQKQLAQAAEESERLRGLLNKTQAELAELKLSTQDPQTPNAHNKRLRPTRGPDPLPFNPNAILSDQW